MARYLLFVLFIIYLLLASCGTVSESGMDNTPEQDTADKTEKMYSRHLPVKEVRKQNGVITSYSVYKYAGGSTVPYEVSIYDRHSLLKERILTEKLGVRTEKKSFIDADRNINRYYVITKDENDNITEQILFGGSNRLIAVEEFIYDENGRKTEWRAFNSSETLLTFNRYYYENGLNTRTDSFHADGTLAEYFINDFDKSGNMVSTKHYNNENELLNQHRITYKNGLVFREEALDRNKKREWYITYSYEDQYRKVIKTTWSASGEELEQVEQTCILTDR